MVTYPVDARRRWNHTAAKVASDASLMFDEGSRLESNYRTKRSVALLQGSKTAKSDGCKLYYEGML
jgi:hypothetical protein